MKKRVLTVLFACVAVFAFIGCGASSSEPVTVSKNDDGLISYSKTIQPILKTHCGNCHYGLQPAGGMIVLSYDEVMKGGKNGPVIVPKDPAASRMVTSIEKTKEPHMPPKFFRELGEDRITAIKQWIAEGAQNN